MALPDDEERKLVEIEQGLASDDPRLAHRFVQLPGPTVGSLVATTIGIIVLLSAGAAIISIGAQLHSPAVIALGAVCTALLPTLAGPRLRR
ncbi:DUF3040 domain-containing protein [Pseudonocardia acaciae]|uniref:DUF3040 domain-containing protein n=1 Tax=Pseudonocardia acaciae TaxID=551276 RepID=UPI00048E3FF0|nr:DUF3040 domain-containing protein [Pseudonocardia acaciae]